MSLGDTLGQFKLVKYARAHVAPENTVYKISTVLGLFEAIESGIGIGHVPCFVADSRKGLKRLSMLDNEFGTDLWLLTHPDLRAAARVRVFLDFLAAEIGKLRPRFEGKISA